MTPTIKREVAIGLRMNGSERFIAAAHRTSSTDHSFFGFMPLRIHLIPWSWERRFRPGPSFPGEVDDVQSRLLLWVGLFVQVDSGRAIRSPAPIVSLSRAGPA